MKENYVLWKNGKDYEYELSIASSWIWCPAIFVSSSIAHYEGLYGLLWFLIPNFLTLIIFGYFMQFSDFSGIYNAGDIVRKASEKQVILHKFVSFVLLVCSVIVQFLGISLVTETFYEIPKIYLSLGVLGISFLIVLGGLKTCIKTDVHKFILILGSCIFLGISLYASGKGCVNFMGYSGNSFKDVTLGFGIVTCIGLLSAPYVDNTLVQRALCLSKKNVSRIFRDSALWFLFVPLGFGILGLTSEHFEGWTLSKAFNSSFLSFVLFIGVIATLISTLDSNLCAIQSLLYSEKFSYKKNKIYGYLGILGVSWISVLIYCLNDLTVTMMFLFYGTLRTCCAIPTILILTNHYSRERLFYGTLIGVLVAPFGYWYFSGTNLAFLFTVFGLLFPLIGYKKTPD